MSDFANLIERSKEPTVKNFGPIGSIKAFDEGVLIRLAGLDVPQLNTFNRAPGGKSLRGKFGPVVHGEAVMAGD